MIEITENLVKSTCQFMSTQSDWGNSNIINKSMVWNIYRYIHYNVMLELSLNIYWFISLFWLKFAFMQYDAIPGF